MMMKLLHWCKCEDLPLELWRDIFARLPSKTLARFRSVCKSWCTTIDDPDFVTMHLTLNKNNADNENHLLVMHSSRGKYIKDLMIQVCSRDQRAITTQITCTKEIYFVLGNCNGLILLWDSENKIRVWNPCIRKCLLLGGYSSCYKDFAFGYSPLSNDYKVVGVGSSSIAVYSLRDGSSSWRKISMKIDERVKLLVHGHYYSSYRSAHWVLGGKSVSSYPYDVVSFNFDSEEFSFVKLPNATNNSCLMYPFIFGKGKGKGKGKSLAMIGISPMTSCIWVLKENSIINPQAPWSLWYTVDNKSSHDVYSYLKDKDNEGVKRFFYDENTSTFLVTNQGNNKLMYYNIKTSHVQVSSGCVSHDWILDYAGTYLETLILCKNRQGQTVMLFPLLYISST